MNELHLFAGAGGGILGGMLLGHTCICAVEIEPYCRKVLFQRQRDGILPKFPIWDDVRTFDGKPWRGKVDVVCGGFPCQDISAAGTTNGNKGLDGCKSGLWHEMFRVVGEVRPRFAFVENSPMLVTRGLDRVLADFSSLGMDTRWGIISAAAAGAPHIRERIWILAHTGRQPWHDDIQECGTDGINNVLSSDGYWQKAKRCTDRKLAALAPGVCERMAKDWWTAQRRMDRSIDGMANRLDRLKAIGNGQVPAVVKLAWETLNAH